MLGCEFRVGVQTQRCPFGYTKLGVCFLALNTIKRTDSLNFFSFCLFLSGLLTSENLEPRGLNFPRQSAATMKHRAKNTVKYSSVEWSTHFTGRNDQDSHGNADTKKVGDFLRTNGGGTGEVPPSSEMQWLVL